MQLVTIGTRYQIVIPKEVRKRMKGIRPGSKVSLYTEDETTATIKTQPQDWVKRTLGIAKEAWKDIDTTKYLEKLRSEWDREY